MGVDRSLRINVEGARELRRAIKQAADEDTAAELKAAYRAAANIIVTGARVRAPHRSGDLRDSIRPLGGATRAVVAAGSAKVPYAGPVHWGWPARHIQPNMFIHDTIHDEWDRIYAVFETAIGRVADKVNN